MKSELIKSPINYIGGKYKLLPQILPLFPHKINMLYDVFGGGASVSLNTDCEFIYYNDLNFYISDMFNQLKGEDIDECLNKIKETIDKFKLSKTNVEGFNELRKYYNEVSKDWFIFYTLMCYSFNNQFRFNNKKEYNSSFGKHKSCFSDVTEKKFINFMNRLNDIDISFDSKDFREVDYSDANENDLVYFDPPYLITCGNYNDGKRGFKGWSQKDDLDLMNLCDDLNDKGVKFALSNVLEHKGKENKILKNWAKKYNINYLNYNYNNCNYQENNKKHKTVEVLITNY